MFLCTLINHNHRHHPIYTKSRLNQIFNLLLSFCIGSPSTRLHLVHHYNHHHYYPSLEDWSHFELNAKGKGLRRILTYLKNASYAMALKRKELVKSKRQRNSLRNELIFIYALSFAFILLNWKVFLFIILPSWILGLSLLLTSNLLNHDGCDTNNSVNHSRDFLNKFENWFFCNNGYHTAHHLNPYLHWTELPKLHQEKVSSLKNSNFTQGSFFYFLYQYCLKYSSVIKH